MAIANLTLNTKNYVYQQSKGGIITWVESTSGIPSGFSLATMSLKAGVGPKPWEVSAHLTLPVIATESDECACIGQVLSTESARINVLIPASWNTAQRTDFALRLRDLAANAQFQAMLSAFTVPN